MIVVTSFSEAGGHAGNEDAFLALSHPAGPDRWLCFLADGQGGQAGGGNAARLACRAASEAARRRSISALIEPDSWRDILGEADQAVCEDRDAGYTTLLGFLVARDYAAGASCGDSAVVLLGGSRPARELTRAQRKNPPVGSGWAQIVPFSAPLPRPWSILAMSDGVWKYVGWDRMVNAARVARGHAVVDALQALARSPRTGAFPDDFTIVLVEDDD